GRCGYGGAVDERSGGLNEAFGRVLSERRRAQEITQEQMWVALGMKPNPYRRLETDGRAITLNIAKAVAGLLGVPLDEMIAEAEKRVTADQPADPTTKSLRSALGFD
ncbi:helix-turn-helix domain-containing protein, partial [Agromyces tardus]|uniref:helix-turn-helix domain-containing protein n=1 Tax=Agromyces tardus TaxID=2583849 RepID=UPI0036074CB8